MTSEHTLGIPASIDEVLITGELAPRPARAPDHAAENRALSALARELAARPRGVLQKLSELALELCNAESAGISILEPGDDGGMFRWHATTGRYTPYLGATIPRDASPCATVIAGTGVQLFREPGRVFPALDELAPAIHEGLLAPWMGDDRAIGTVWAIGHDPERQFDAEDARLLQSLTSFAAAAYRMVTNLGALEEHQRELEERVVERTSLLTQRNQQLRREVEQRREVEAALRDSRAQLQAALSIETVGVLFFELGSAIVDANPAFERMSGYSARALRELDHWKRLTAPEFYEPTENALHELETTGRTAPYEKQMLRRDGSRFWTLCAPTRISGAGAAPTCVEFILDISAAKAVEDKLREGEARFRALADAAPALIWQLDPDGNAVYQNKRFAEIVGLPAERLLGGGWRAILHPDDAAGHLEAVERALREQSGYQRRMRIRVRDEGWHWFEAHAAPWFGVDGAYRGHVGISIDISATVQTEELLKDADRRKDEFLATLAHELRNPLAPISNAMHLLRRPDGRRSADRMLEMIERQVRQMVRLVNDLMDVSRITRGKIGLDKAPVPLSEILASAIETSEPVIDAARHTFEVTMTDEVLVLHADKVRLTQVFANLLNNAAKYTDHGGQIWLDVRREDDCAVVSVRDNGIGIASADLPHVFDMFAQAHAPSDRHQGGLGIGLTMVRNLVAMHGGTVEAHSEGPGRGSEFIVRLPLRRQLPPARDAPDARTAHGAAPLARRHVLVVDDNRDAADSLRLLLQGDGAEVEVRYDGPAALQALAQMAAPPDVLILDIGMPGMDGYAVARQVRQDPRLQGLRIIALTGWGQSVDRMRSHDNGIDHHLTKPVDWTTLQRLVAAR